MSVSTDCAAPTGSGSGADVERGEGAVGRGEGVLDPLSSEHGTYTTVKARFWPWRFGESLESFASCSLESGHARRRDAMRAARERERECVCVSECVCERERVCV